MSTQKKVGAVAVLATALTTAGLAWWSVAPESRFYAAEKDVATAQQLGQVRDLSQAFNHVAELMRPSVVSINSVKRVEMRGRRQTPQLPQGIPEQFRQFFDEDFMERFENPGTPFEQYGLGSGVIVSEDGYILTNNHVVREADEITVRLHDERELRAKIVGTDEKTDVAVLKVDGTKLTPAKLGNSDAMKVGEWVLAIGSPFGLDQTVTAGIISAKGRVTGIIGREGYEDFIQTDAAINPGNSGGPLVNMRGEVIAVNTAIASRGSAGNVGVGFAIPANMARHIMESIISTGKVVRGWLGAAIQPLDEGLAESFSFDSRRGVLISGVLPDSPAQKAGLRDGDIVVELNGQPMLTTSQLRNSIAALAPNSQANLVIFRNGKKSDVSVTIGELASDATTGAVEPSSPGTPSNQLGLRVETLTPELASQIGHRGESAGVVVLDVVAGSVADRASLQRGDVIVSISSQPIRNAGDFRAAVAKADLEQGVRMQVLREGVKRFVFLRNGG